MTQRKLSHYLLFLTLTILLLFCVSGCGNNISEKSAEPADYNQLTIIAAQNFVDNDAKKLRKLFSKNLKNEINANQLSLEFFSIRSFYGTAQYYQTDQIKLANQESAVVATVPVVMENGKIRLSFIFNGKGEISNFFWMDGDSPSSALPLANDTEVIFGSEDHPIIGALTLPSGEGPFPCVILMPGLSYSDRNEQIGANMPLRDIAEQLSAQGIAVLRYDRRDYTYAVEMSEMEDYDLHDWIIDDYCDAVAFLQQRDDILSSGIFSAGHGFSGYLLPMLAKETPSGAGYILLSAPARTIDQVLYDQTEYVLTNNSAIDDKTRKKLLSTIEKSMEEISKLTSKSDTSAEELFGLPVSVWLDLQDYDPLTDISGIYQPILIVQGGRDYQTNLQDFEAWKTTSSDYEMNNVQLLYCDNLNHIYQTGTGKSLPSEYLVAGKVSNVITDAIVSFVRNQLPPQYLTPLTVSEAETTTADLLDGMTPNDISIWNEMGQIQ